MRTLPVSAVFSALAIACGAPDHPSWEPRGALVGTSPATTDRVNPSGHALACTLAGEAELDGNVLYDSADLKRPIAFFAAKKRVAVEVTEIRYRAGYYEYARVHVKAPASSPAVNVDGWMHLGDLRPVLNARPGETDCLASAPEIDPRRKPVVKCEEHCLKDAFDLPDLRSKHRVSARAVTDIFAAPSESAAKIGTAERGAELVVMESRGPWSKVALPSGELVSPASTPTNDGESVDFWIRSL
jgi:hypothetical protein